MRPHARQPGQLVIELRQVHLAHTRHIITDVHFCLCSVYLEAHPHKSAEQACTCS